MLDMSTWPRRAFGVTSSLRLDPKNVRLGLDFDGTPPQGDIIQDLFQTEGAFDLAQAIVTVGFLTHELPVVLKEDGQWVVVEGNRRVAAIKALLNPFLVPAFQPRLTRLIADSPPPTTIARIECLVAPSRDEANKLIASLHTSNPRRAWGPIRQADFFSAQIRAGKTVEELKVEYPGIDVADFVQTAEMQRLLQSATYQDEDLVDFVHKKTFPISTFERLYKNPDFRQLAKVSVDSGTGHVSFSGNRADFSKLAEKIVADIKIRKIDTRVLNKPDAKSYKDYMGELAPFAVRKGLGEKVADLPEAPKPARRAKATTRLGVSDLHPIAGYPATERLILEMGRLPYNDFPNATFDLIRTFLEKSIKAYAASLNATIAPRRSGAFVYLDDALEWLAQEIKQSNGPRALQGVIQKLRSNKRVNQYQLTKEYLDAANHNHEIFIVKDEVKDLWDSVDGLLRYVLRERI